MRHARSLSLRQALINPALEHMAGVGVALPVALRQVGRHVVVAVLQPVVRARPQLPRGRRQAGGAQPAADTQRLNVGRWNAWRSDRVAIGPCEMGTCVD
eukprot:3928817-Prymnesium_polylepis.2